MKKLHSPLIFLLLLSFSFCQNAFAARFGRGRSYGMQRRINPHNYTGPSHYTYNPGNPQNPMTSGYNSNQTPPRRGMGAGTAAALGAAAGAAGGYMVGRNMAHENTPSTTSSAPEVQTQNYNQPLHHNGHGIPWGIIAILAIILGFGLMLFRKSKPTPSGMNDSSTNNNFGLFQSKNSDSQQHMQQQPNSQESVQIQQQSQTAQPPIMNAMEKMPDGVETIYFLRQVKGMFLHIQSMNNSENINEIEKYMTPELYSEMASSISANTSIADFTNLECQLLDCQLENNSLVASVKFFGLVSEDANSAVVPFSEVWNFIKKDLATNKWIIAGIQQETSN